MRRHHAFVLRLGFLLLALVLAGCSALKLGYANGDTFVYWWLNGYVDFTPEQKPWVKAHIDRLFDWHRKTQLRDYAQLLAQVQERLRRGPTTPQEIRADFDAVRKRAVIVLDKAVPELTDLAMSMQPQQIAHLEKKFESNNEKYRKEFLQGSIEDRQRLRFKKVMNQAEYWFGNFSKEQEAKIRAASDGRPMDYEIWMNDRVKRQEAMLQMLRKIQKEHPSREAVSQMIRDFIKRAAENYTYAENRQFFDDSTEGAAQMIAVIVNIATPSQKDHAIKRLQKWIDDSVEVAAK